MLKAVAGVRDEVLKRCRGGAIDLETITRVFIGLTAVDEIVFVRYETPPENPIWGEFTRWSMQPGAYRSFHTIVEIRYAAHLSEDWLRFIVCKELCHALITAEGAHDVSLRAMESLVDSFALMSAQGMAQVSPAMQCELVAVAGALELLCPIQLRKALLDPGPLDEAGISSAARDFNIPREYAELAFRPGYIAAVESLLENG